MQEHLIEVYRQIIEERYQFDRLNDTYDLPEIASPENIEAVRTYFLEYVYPPPSIRLQLNKGFAALEGHLKKPAELLRLLGDVSGLAFRFGLQFPRAVRAGLTSLESFKAALQFEKGLLQATEDLDMEAPLSIADFERCIAELPRHEMDHFISEFDDLLSSLTDTKLLGKTITILKELHERMQGDSSVYSQAEQDGLQAGIDILENGLLLFQDFSKKEKQLMIQLIQTVEKDELDRIFSTYAS